MKKDKCFQLGTIRKPHGFRGEVTAHFDVDDVARYRGLDALFVETGGALVPMFIVSMQMKNNNLVKLQLEGILDEESARRLSGSPMWLPLKVLPEAEEGEIYLHDLIGYLIRDERLGELGRVEDVIEHPGNTLMRVDKAGKEILIPYQEAFVRDIDSRNRVILLSLPEGFEELW
jgi:16S rRNA processing protein RimM